MEFWQEWCPVIRLPRWQKDGLCLECGQAHEPITVWNWLIHLNREEQCVPNPEKKFTTSSSAIKRMLENKAVTINGDKPGPKDNVMFPVDELVFFKGSKSQVTIQ